MTTFPHITANLRGRLYIAVLHLDGGPLVALSMDPAKALDALRIAVEREGRPWHVLRPTVVTAELDNPA